MVLVKIAALRFDYHPSPTNHNDKYFQFRFRKDDLGIFDIPHDFEVVHDKDEFKGF